MVRERIVIIFLLLIIIMLVIAKIAITDFIDQFNQLSFNEQQEIHLIDTENSILEDELLSDESYIKIASEAAKMGYR